MWARTRQDGTENPLFLTRKNEYIELDRRVKFTHDLNSAINYGEVIIISILSQQLDSLMQNIKQIDGYAGKKYCLAMKGVEASTGRRLSEVLLDAGVMRENIAVLVGPGHIQSIAHGEPTHMLISAYSEDFARFLVDSLGDSKSLNLTRSDDIIGTELGAAAKNVIGIASGVLEGSGCSQMKGPLMVASTLEIGKFIDAMGGDSASAYGLAFLGDFHATLYDHNSKNLTYGRRVAETGSLDPKLLGVDVQSTEGINTSSALVKLQQRYNARVSNAARLNMPITSAVNDITNGRVKLDNVGGYLNKKITEAINL